MAPPVTGRCLCGGVAYETAGNGIMGYCHCSICRKWSGALFTTNLNAERSGFRFLKGEELISGYESSAGGLREHCRCCGSIAPGGPRDAPWIAIPAGQLEADPGLRPAGHVFYSVHAPWLELDDELPRFDLWPPAFTPEWAQGIQSAADLPGPPTDWKPASGAARGSCLCGTVRYEVDPVPVRFVRCHCSRCRRALGSAYACNLVVAPERFRWTAGRESMVRYDLPEARSFANEFCRECGSSLPHPTRSGREVIVPTGTLDDDPGLRVEGDLHLEDRPAWV